MLQGGRSKWSLKLVSHALQCLRRLSLGSLHHQWKEKKREKTFFSICVSDIQTAASIVAACWTVSAQNLNSVTVFSPFSACFYGECWSSDLREGREVRTKTRRHSSGCSRNTLAALVNKSEKSKPLRKSWPSEENRCFFRPKKTTKKKITPEVENLQQSTRSSTLDYWGL